MSITIRSSPSVGVAVNLASGSFLYSPVENCAEMLLSPSPVSEGVSSSGSWQPPRQSRAADANDMMLFFMG